MNKKKVGRPSRKCETKQKFFNLRKDLAEKLETYPNQTKIIEDALELNFDLDSQSNTHLYLRKETLERELKSVDSLLSERQRKVEQERQRLNNEQKKWQIDYDRFCMRLQKVAEIIDSGKPFDLDITKITNTYCIKISEKQYQSIMRKYREGKFSIDDFKKIRSKWLDDLKLKNGV